MHGIPTFSREPRQAGAGLGSGGNKALARCARERAIRHVGYPLSVPRPNHYLEEYDTRPTLELSSGEDMRAVILDVILHVSEDTRKRHVFRVIFAYDKWGTKSRIVECACIDAIYHFKTPDLRDDLTQYPFWNEFVCFAKICDEPIEHIGESRN